jgi:hypothetical protein
VLQPLIAALGSTAADVEEWGWASADQIMCCMYLFVSRLIAKTGGSWLVSCALDWMLDFLPDFGDKIA